MAEVDFVSYEELKGLEHIYLEDSYVLNIQAYPNVVEFTLEVVLTEEHPLYSPRLPNEQYCYRDATLRFPDVQHLIWDERILRASTDASGSIDYGNIDEFFTTKEGFHLTGDWGSITIESSPPVLSFAGHSNP